MIDMVKCIIFFIRYLADVDIYWKEGDVKLTDSRRVIAAGYTLNLKKKSNGFLPEIITFLLSQILEILMLCLSRSVTVTYSQWKILTFLVFGRSISVPCESLSMLGDPGTTGCDGVRFQDHSASAKNQMSEDFTY